VDPHPSQLPPWSPPPLWQLRSTVGGLALVMNSGTSAEGGGAAPARAAEGEAGSLPGAAVLPPELAEKLRAAGAARDPAYKPRTRHLRPDGSPEYTNRLFLERGPYLQQHAHNPVNWSHGAIRASSPLVPFLFLLLCRQGCTRWMRRRLWSVLFVAVHD